MALLLKYQEGGETPKYSLYGDEYDFHDLERRVYEGFDDFIPTIKYGKKNREGIYSAVKDLMNGLLSGRVTFENGTFVDHEGEYHNDSKLKHDNYGMAAAWILRNMGLADKIAPPTPETKDKYNSSVLGNYVLNLIFGNTPTVEDLLRFINQDPWLDDTKTSRNNSKRIEMLLSSINTALSDFDNIVDKYDISDEEKEEQRNRLIRAKEALEDNVLSDDEYLILSRALGPGKWEDLMKTDFSTLKEEKEEEEEEEENAVPQGKKRYIYNNEFIDAPEGMSIDDIVDNYIRNQKDYVEDESTVNIFNDPEKELTDAQAADIDYIRDRIKTYNPVDIIKGLNDYYKNPNDTNNLRYKLTKDLEDSKFVEGKDKGKSVNNPEAKRRVFKELCSRLVLSGYCVKYGDRYIIKGVEHPNKPNKVLVVDLKNNTFLWISKYKNPEERNKISDAIKYQNSGVVIHKRGGSLKFNGGGRVVKGQEGSNDEDWWKNVYFGITDFNPNDYNLGEYWGYKGDLNSIKTANPKKRGLTISRRSPHGQINYAKPQEELNSWREKYYKNDADTKRAKNLEYAYKQWLSDTDENKGDFLTWYNKNLQYLYNYRKGKAESGKKWYANDARKFNEIYDKLYHDVNEDNDYSIGREEDLYDWYGTATALRHFDRTDNNFRFNLDAISDENIRKALEDLNISKASQGFIYKGDLPEVVVTPETAPVAEEQPKPTSHVDPNLTEKKEGFDWVGLGKNLLPEALSVGRLAGTLRNNNRAYRILNRALHPYLQDTYERYSPVTGEFGLMSAYNLLAADYNRLAARNATSDASINYLARLDANRRANQLREQGFLKDNDEIKRTATEALLRQEDNAKRRSDTANLNRESIHDTIREKANLAAEHIKQNWGAWDNFLSGIEQRLRTRSQEKESAYRTIMQDIALLRAKNEYESTMYPYNEGLKAWANEHSTEPITNYPQYSQFMLARTEALNKLQNTLLESLAQTYGLKYNPTTYSIKYKTGGKLIKRKK